MSDQKLILLIGGMRHGGSERVMSILANEWTARGKEVHLFMLLSEPSFYPLDNNVNLHAGYGPKRSQTSGFLDHAITRMKTIYRLYKGMRKIKADYIISFGIEMNIMAIILAKLMGRKVIICERSNPARPSTKKYWLKLRKVLFKRANKIVIQTKRTAELFHEIGVELPPYFIIENPISSSFKYITKEREKLILSIGRLTPEKGHDLLIEALSLVDLDEWKVIIIGDGILYHYYQEMIIKKGLEDKVKLVGKKSHVQEYLKKASVFVLPSRLEGFPNTLAEAMISQCACISFDCDTGPRELIDNQKNGLLVPIENVNQLAKSIYQLINDESIRNALSKEATKVFERLNTETIMNRWEHVLLSNYE